MIIFLQNMDIVGDGQRGDEFGKILIYMQKLMMNISRLLFKKDYK